MDPAERIRRVRCEDCYGCNGSCPLRGVLDAAEEMMDTGRTKELDNILAARLSPERVKPCGQPRVYTLPYEPREEREAG